MKYLTYLSTIAVLSLTSISATDLNKGSALNPVPAGCEATPLELKTEVKEPKQTGFQKIDEFNTNAKLFRIQALSIANTALETTVTMCQVKDPELGEYTHRECYTRLALNRKECDVTKNSKAELIAGYANTLVSGAALVLTAQALIKSAGDVSKSTLDEAMANPMKLKNARSAAKSLEETVSEVKNSMIALQFAMKYAQGSRAALENWDLQ